MRIGPHFTTVTWGLKSKHRKVLLVRCFLVFLLILFFRNTGLLCHTQVLYDKFTDY